MTPGPRRWFWGLLVLQAVYCTAAWAQSASALLNSGQYLRARSAFEDSLGADRQEAIEGFFESFLQRGDFQEGLAEAERLLARWPRNAFVLYGKGRLLQETGQLIASEEAFIAAVGVKPDYWRAGLALAELFEAVGQERQARRLYETLHSNLRYGSFDTAEARAIGARAAAGLQEYHDANDALSTALALEPGHVQHLLWHGELYQVTYDVAQAQTLYEEAISINPHRAELYVALGHATASYARKESLARRALEQMPNSVEARALLASLHILDGRHSMAEALLDEALDINPASMAALAQLATLQHLNADSAAFAQTEARVLANYARPVDFYRTVSEGLALRFRYPDAAVMASKAVDANPDDAAANATLGTALLRLGRRTQARSHLERAYERDAFNLFVANTLSLLDDNASFKVLESVHFQLRIHSREADILGPIMLREAEAAYRAMAPRYPYRPTGKVVIEAYNDADDFAVRIAGVPHMGLLGVSFGDVVAVNTPEARGGTPYNWARTLWHEIAHTMAIGTSHFHVPRWLTEGLALYEEQRAYPQWAREYELRFFMAFDQDRLHPLEEIDRGFTRPAFPGQVMMSYYHAYRVVDYIVQQHGFGAVTDMLEELRASRTQEEALRSVLGVSRRALDEAFRASLDAHRAQLRDVLQGWPDMLTEEATGESLEAWLKQQGRNSLMGSLRDGAEAMTRGDDEDAEAHFLQALELYPPFTGAGNAYEGLATLYRRRGDETRLASILESYLAVTPYGAAWARELSAIHERRGVLARARALLERSRRSTPYDEELLRKVAELAARAQDHDARVEARRAILALSPVDLAGAYYALASALYDDDRILEAKRAVLQSLEIAPGYKEAQLLLLECVDGAR